MEETSSGIKISLLSNLAGFGPRPTQGLATKFSNMHFALCLSSRLSPVLLWCFACLKVTEHSFACALANVIQHMHKDLLSLKDLQKTNKHAVDSVISLFAKCPHFLFFFRHNCMQCIDSFSILLQRYAREGINVKNLTIFKFFLCNQKNLVKCSTCMVSKKIAIEHGIAFSEICLFHENHLLEFHKICQLPIT